MDSFCVGRHREGFRQLAEQQTDILFANEDELLALYETDRLDTALDALSGLRPVVCVTRGAKGSVIQAGICSWRSGWPRDGSGLGGCRLSWLYRRIRSHPTLRRTPRNADTSNRGSRRLALI